MDKKRAKIQQSKDEIYREQLQKSGLLEVRVHLNNKDYTTFINMADDIANEYVQPAGKKPRLTKAKRQLLSELINNRTHEYFTLKDRVRELEAEIECMAKEYYESDSVTESQEMLPQAISALPDDPADLKRRLARIHSIANSNLQKINGLQRELTDARRSRDSYRALYEQLEEEKEALSLKLEQYEHPNQTEEDKFLSELENMS